MLVQNSKNEIENQTSHIKVRVDQISRLFKIPDKPEANLIHRLDNFFLRKKKSYADLWALKDVSFEVKKGEALGVIGKNGSGKSTLLHILAQTLQPTSGEVHIHGKITPILNLGIGFQGDLTAEENVVLLGQLLGMKKERVKEKLDTIFEYSEIQKFRYSYLRHFSSGMYARLAFATSIHIEPDILLLDEVLAVGDKDFREKSLKSMYDFRDKDVTIVFVTHNLSEVKKFCTHCLWLHEGKVRAYGKPEEIVSAYERS